MREYTVEIIPRAVTWAIIAKSEKEALEKAEEIFGGATKIDVVSSRAVQKEEYKVEICKTEVQVKEFTHKAYSEEQARKEVAKLLKGGKIELERYQGEDNLEIDVW